MTSALDAALDDVRALLQADGGDLELVAEHGDAVRLRLLLADAGCADCVLPAPLLADVVREALTRRGVPVGRVDIEDPREAT